MSPFSQRSFQYSILRSEVANVRSYRSIEGCIAYLTYPVLSGGIFVYSESHHYVLSGVLFIRRVPAMCYDFLVLVLSIVKLSKQPSKSSLGERLRAQGLLYFVIAAMAYIPPTVWTLHAALPVTILTHRYPQVFGFIGSTRMNAFFPVAAHNSTHPSYGGYHWEHW